MFRNADVAARRDRCDWDMPLREQGYEECSCRPEPGPKAGEPAGRPGTVHVEPEMEGWGRSLAPDGFCPPRDIGRNGVLIRPWYPLQSAGRFMDVVQEWQQRPGSPNLYWALAGLPKPFADFRGDHAIRADEFVGVPQLHGMNTAAISEQDWRDFQDRINGYISMGRSITITA